MTNPRADQIAGLEQSIADLEEKQRTTGVDLSATIAQLRDVMTRLESAKTSTSTSNRSGGIDVKADTLNAQGDIVGRDKVGSQVTNTIDATKTGTLTGAGAIAQGDRAVAAGAGGLAIGGNVTGPVYVGNEPPESTPVPRQIPRMPDYYVARVQDEDELTRAILNKASNVPITVLYGWSGTGKTLLAAHVLNGLPNDAFKDGILWGDLAGRSFGEVMWNFLCALDAKWRRTPPPDNASSLRELLWQNLSGKCALLVFDNAKESRQIDEFLPSDLGLCRLLVISIPSLTDLKAKHNVQRLGPFKKEEALALFRTILGSAQSNSYAEVLQEIIQRLEYLPQLVANVALNYSEGKLSPATYLHSLRESESRSRILGGSAQLGLEAVTQTLSPSQLDLFELIGILADGDWHYRMLAAVALRRPAEVKQTLDVFVSNGLVESAGNDRYRVNTFILEFVRERLASRSEYAIQAAYHLLARYCLDIAQDLESTLVARTDLNPVAEQPMSQLEKWSRAEEFVLAFKDKIASEMSHIFKVLSWAEANENWDLILRFSYTPYVGLIQGLIANAQELSLSLSMARIIDPIIAPHGPHAVQVYDVIGSINRGVPGFQVSAYDKFDSTERCDLNLNIAAGRVYDGLFDQVNLNAVKWIGVRANGLILRTADLIGSQLVACDFSRAVWIDCDARYTILMACNFGYAVFKNVILRGANLRDVSFTGAVLDNVDLRDADLRGADFSGARFRAVNLIGCRLDNVRWAGVSGSISATDDPQLLAEEIDHALRQGDRLDSPYQFTPTSGELDADFSSANIHDADLRALDFTGFSFENANMHTSDLRAAILLHANLEHVNLHHSTLRAADLSDADLTSTNLHTSDLLGARLPNANLENANLHHTTLRATDLRNCNFTNANLSAADLRAADLAAAELSHCNLSNANLSNALNLRDEQLSRAGRLRGAVLAEGNLYDGRYNCAGDLDDARANGIDLNDVEAMAEFYGTTNDSKATAVVRATQEFGDILHAIDLRSEDPTVDKDDLREVVRKIEEEVKKEERANPAKIERGLKFLAEMAPDVLDMTIVTLVNPMIGISPRILAVAQTVRNKYDVIRDKTKITATSSALSGNSAIASITISNAFGDIVHTIDTNPLSPYIDKEELKHTVRKVEEEVRKGEQADPAKVEHWLKSLGEMDAEILEVISATLTDPALGLATVIKRIAQKARSTQDNV
jgi:uncharacterized protein YjbI with pentapeptide repeats